jgi:hypothetical protein
MIASGGINSGLTKLETEAYDISGLGICFWLLRSSDHANIICLYVTFFSLTHRRAAYNYIKEKKETVLTHHHSIEHA